MTDQDEWSDRRFFSPIDDAALGRYFTKLAEVTPEEKARIEGIFDKAIDEGVRPKEAVRRALGEP
jgi:hypothetical protein